MRKRPKSCRADLPVGRQGGRRGDRFQSAATLGLAIPQNRGRDRDVPVPWTRLTEISERVKLA